MLEVDRRFVLRRAIKTLMVGDSRGVCELFTPDVSCWSPNLLVASQDELLAALTGCDDALTDVEVDVGSVDVIGDKAIAEWVVTGVFSTPFLVDDDVLIEPNGRRLAVAGVTVAEFEGEKICRLRNYFDDAAFLEQMLVEP
jgi:ketosteroid isomerase-like protein